jgi:EAL domain-containing protein (putative c-di-GMP-specific phosphodiesterase class I)
LFNRDNPVFRNCVKKRTLLFSDTELFLKKAISGLLRFFRIMPIIPAIGGIEWGIMFPVAELIEKKAIRARFQPIVSLRTKSVIGFEALCFAKVDNIIIPPCDMFAAARREGMLIELDRHCRSVSLATYTAAGFAGRFLLFINFESSLIDLDVAGSGFFLNQCREAAIPLSSVVIEIVESGVSNDAALESFVARYRSHGFVIAVDDVGEGYSNLNRIALICPDIIKADKTLATGIDINFTKQRIVASLAGLSRGIGSLFLLEGIEREEEALTAFALGVDLAQGYFIGRPEELDLKSLLAEATGCVVSISSEVRQRSILRITSRSEYIEWCFSALEDVASCLTSEDSERFDECLGGYRDELAECECIYIVDEKGIQATETILSGKRFPQSRPSTLFCPAPRGSDHSMKEYFYAASIHKRRYSTDPYVSLATGRPCITLSVPFVSNCSGESFYLCADFSASEIL